MKALARVISVVLFIVAILIGIVAVSNLGEPWSQDRIIVAVTAGLVAAGLAYLGKRLWTTY